VPLALAADGAFAIGVKVGRRSMDVLLVDFRGAVRERWTTPYSFPEPAAVLAQIRQRLADIHRLLGPAGSERLQGIGMAAPLSLGGWRELLGFPVALADQWDATDLRAEVARFTELPVSMLKDTAAACVAELVAGRGRSAGSFLYLFVDTFIGGGLVIDSHLRAGMHGNAGAVGSLPLGLPQGQSPSQRPRAPQQLLEVASLLVLERRYLRAGLDATASGDARALQEPWRPITDAWLQDAANAMALAANSAACLLDLDVVIVDGSFGRDLLAALLAALDDAMARYSWEGVVRPQVLAGTIGSDARAMGGALMPLHANFSPDRELFLKVVEAP
jgi:predicted NBD/HSP70 family sugar kinase